MLWWGLKAAVVAVLTTDVRPIERSFTVDPEWRRIDPDQGAARLGPRQTIAPQHLTGRWRHVDPRVSYTGWRSLPKAAATLLWALLVAAFGWLGWSRGRGPLAELASYRHEDGEAEGGWDPVTPATPSPPAVPASPERWWPDRGAADS